MRRILLSTIVLLLLFAGRSSASHSMGGNLTYHCLGNGQYELTFTLFRDCSGILPANSIEIDYYSSCTAGFDFTMLNLASPPVQINTVCPTMTTTCNGGTFTGIEAYTYTGIVTLPVECSDWTFYHDECCRNAAITNILDPDLQDQIIWSQLNNTNGICDDSPVFTNDPVPFACDGQAFCFNQGAFDAEGDSLVYSLYPPLTLDPTLTQIVPVTYLGGLTYDNPLYSNVSINFDAATGDFCVTPNGTQVTVFAVLVDEYRNGVYIGTVERDIQLTVNNCSNIIPTLSGINGTGSFDATVCAGQQLCFWVKSTDSNNPDSTFLNWNNGITGATFNSVGTKRDSAQFCWTPTVADAGPNPHCFTVQVQDNACPYPGSQTLSYCITVNSVDATMTSTNIPCFGGTGSATVTASGGSPNYSYAWTPSGGAGANANNLAAGTYSVTVTDSHGCTTTASATITQPTQVNGVINTTNPTCGSTNGSASIAASGGTGPYTYSWSPSGGNGATASNLGGGNYTVTITDSHGCSNTIGTTLAAPSAPVAYVSGTTNSSCLSPLGTITIAVIGGTGPYTYAWTPSGGNAATASNLQSGTYTCTVTDAAGCSSSASSTIGIPPTINASITASADASCNGVADGSATVTATNGSPNYAYVWAPAGGNSQTANGLSAGTYTVTVTDVAGCTATTTVTIAAPPAIVTNATPSPILCNGNPTGSATVVANGGTGVLTYSWSPSGGSGATASGLSAGTYTVTVSDANGCTNTAAAVVTEPTLLTLQSSSTPSICGQASGSASAVAGGGTAAYTYTWSPSGGNTANAANLGTGNYTVTVTDANGCTNSSTTNVADLPGPTSTLSASTNVSCFGGANGTADVNANGGSAPLAYSWTPSGGNAANATGLSAGTYTVTVTDANGCTATTQATITQPTQLLASITSNTNSTCSGSNNGSIAMSANGGSPGYTYSWTPSGGNATSLSGLAPGTYTATITDANGCTTTTSATITEPNPVTASIISSPAACFGGSTGNATVTANGGTGALAYAWSPSGGSGATASNLAAGTYDVTVTDANGCTTTATSTVTQPSATSLLLSASSNVTCAGAANGTATVTASGGTLNYSYTWTPSGGNAASATGLSAGNYTITLTDANGCTATTSATITQPTPLVSNILNSSNVTCFGLANGTATAYANGGTVAYTYSWSPSGGNNTSATNLAAGNYTITITDANGCTSSSTVVITQPNALSLALQTSTNVSCNGGANGSATVSAAGGTVNYTYAWTPTGGNGVTASGLSAGNYTATVTDANGCTFSTTANITQPTAIALTPSATPATCGSSNGSAAVTAVGGSGGYTYSWSPSGGNGSSASNLIAGNYIVTVTDAAGCTESASASVSNIGGPTIAASVVSQVSCFGGTNGSASVNVSAGTGPFTYQWSPSGGAGITASNLGAGSYSITVLDANGCSSSSNVNITQPTAVSVIASSASASCFGASTGSANAVASGGTSPYLYSWTPGGSMNNSITNLAAGNYAVTVTDANGCTISQSTTVNQPTIINLNFSNTPSSCGVATGSATVVAGGGTGPYTYNWTPIGGNSSFANALSAGIYTATITDANGCTMSGTTQVNNIGGPSITPIASANVSCNGGTNGSASISVNNGTAPYTYAWTPYGGNTSSASGLGSGAYSVTVSDANGCQTSYSFTINEPSAIVLVPSTVSATCGATNGSASINATGGTGTLSYSWIGYPGATSTTLSNVGSGNYTVVVTDASGCSTSQTIAVSSIGGANAILQTSTDVSCNGGTNGSATISATGGTLPLTYSWSPSGGNGPSASGLSADSYIVTVTDATGCATTVNVLISEPNAIVLTGSSTPASCNGGTNGSVSVTVSGGQSPYSYQWTGYLQNSAQILNLGIGNYSVTVTDANGCIENALIPVNSATAIALTLSSTDVNCSGAANGTANVIPAGGTAPYTYVWSPSGGNAATATNLSGGNYSITVTDANGCASIDNLVIDEPSPLQMTISPAITLCIGQSTLLDASVTGGVLPYVYQWSNGIIDSSQTVSPTTSANYSITVTDANGCSAGTQTIPVTVNPPLSISANGPFNICVGVAVSLESLAQGGDGNYAYTWSNGILTSNQTITPTASGPMNVIVTDGCGTPQAVTQVDITVNPMPDANFGPYTANGCAPVTVNFHDNSTTASGSAYTWDFGDAASSNSTNPIHTYTAPGVYTVELAIVTPAGCSDSQTIVNLVNVYENPVAAFTATPPNVSILGPDISFTNNSVNGDNYIWNFGDGSPLSYETNPAHSYSDTGSYEVMLITTTANGCIDTITGIVRVDDDFTIYIPNAFTPNFDNVNDEFNAYGIGWKDFNLYVLDRWGLNIYHSTDHSKPWDGTYEGDGNPCQADVYVYKIQVNDNAGKLHSFIGHVSLVR